MQYPPNHHQEEGFLNIINLMQAYPLATINSCLDNEIETSHTPLIYEANDGLGLLIGHLDKFNPQLVHFKKNEKVNIIFNGPDVYISPSVYSTTQLPTWNYFKAHIKGRVILETDQEKVKHSLINMTAFLEGDTPNYVLEADNPRMANALDYIVGFRIIIDAWEGKYKISQDKRKEDRALAKQAMIIEAQKTEKAVDLLYSAHLTKPKQN
ncbi:FMN-binding negative transcriptional regulator [Flavobacteriaceae bacterium]|nr:FMN-binding negative transcriptional regulator [Flavobacteriaceae bacterium]MDC1060899.1 FMN-binding negative transcriptional regulator [Flavobacteriaceae bacterium]